MQQVFQFPTFLSLEVTVHVQYVKVSVEAVCVGLL